MARHDYDHFIGCFVERIFETLFSKSPLSVCSGKCRQALQKIRSFDWLYSIQLNLSYHLALKLRYFPSIMVLGNACRWGWVAGSPRADRSEGAIKCSSDRRLAIGRSAVSISGGRRFGVNLRSILRASGCSITIHRLVLQIIINLNTRLFFF